MAIFLQVDGVKGDVTADGHKDWIECTSMQWGVGRGIHTPTGSAQERESSSPSVSEVTVTKNMDKATAALVQEACVGRSKPVVIHLVQTGDKLETFMEYKLTDCLISGYSVSSGGEGKPSESVSFNFTKVEIKYTAFDNKHNPAGTFTSGYDVSAGKKL